MMFTSFSLPICVNIILIMLSIGIWTFPELIFITSIANKAAASKEKTTTYLIDEKGIIVKGIDKVKASDNPQQMLEMLD